MYWNNELNEGNSKASRGITRHPEASRGDLGVQLEALSNCSYLAIYLALPRSRKKICQWVCLSNNVRCFLEREKFSIYLFSKNCCLIGAIAVST